MRHSRVFASDRSTVAMYEHQDRCDHDVAADLSFRVWLRTAWALRPIDTLERDVVNAGLLLR